jgi:2-octaprenyl-6-methoxyphenol hydroxylase
MSTPVQKHYDIVIVGGGLIGLSLAAALGQANISVLLIEKNTAAPVHANVLDMRTSGLTRSTERFFLKLGLWQEISDFATPIEQLEISEQQGFGCARIDGQRFGMSPIGFMAPNNELIAVLSRAVHACEGITILSPASLSTVQNDKQGYRIEIDHAGEMNVLTTALLVGADGAQSQVRKLLSMPFTEKNYQQTAIISNIRPERPHQNIAYERLTENGPLAVLPGKENLCALIWTHASDQVGKVAALSDEEFIDQLHASFGYRLGRFLEVGKRVQYPLGLNVSEKLTRSHAVLVGNAAQSIHPVAAQGFNLGIRDVQTLVHLLCECSFSAHKYAEILQKYETLRGQDRSHVIRLTDGLTKVFSRRAWPLPQLRSLGIRALGSSKSLQKAFLRRNSGLRYLLLEEPLING